MSTLLSSILNNGSEPTLFKDLVDWFPTERPILVAFSGGVDSTLVLKAAAMASKSTIAVTAVSQSLPKRELELTKQLAASIGVEHLTTFTRELSNINYQNNAGDRCYYCKTEFYSSLMPLFKNYPNYLLVDGLHADDQLEDRPGFLASKQAGVLHPLRELGLGKVRIRQLAQESGLVNWNKAEMACLASRIPVGTKVDAEKLRMVEQAEDLLHEVGLGGSRVRLHELNADDSKPLYLARIELSNSDISLVHSKSKEITDSFRAAGFAFITLDLEGYRKGGRQIL